ncbi:betaine operon transcriptional regulator [Geomicrobium sp. JCM 19037]|nr:GbsR/MarR family transcriptional regulator [Geomicrobium sp. JCM 19037]GAK04438.1 betaine operon transcriptional regulator [Geomicrobium sp. JCM 19037]
MESLSNDQLLTELQAAEDQITDRIADNMETFGVSSTVGRLLGIIYMNREAMTLDALAEETGMSKTRMSQVMRQMLALNIAEKEFVKGSRKEHYNVESDYAQTFISLFTTNWKEVVSRNMTLERRLRERVDHMKTSLSSETPVEIKDRVEALSEELDAWQAYYNWIDRLVYFFESGQIFDHVPLRDSQKEDNHHEK